MKRVSGLLLAAFVVLVLAPRAEAAAEVGVRYWFSDFASEVQVTEDNILGTDIDLTDDIDVDQSKNFLEGRVSLHLGSHEIRYGFISMSWDGADSITKTINFAGRTFNIGSSLDATLDVDYHRLGYRYDFVDTLDNRAGVIVELKYLDVDASLEEPLTATDESEAIEVALPTIGVAGQAALPLTGLSVNGEITGITIGSRGHIYDVEGALNFQPAPFVVLSGGYRILVVHADVDDNEVDIAVSGPFVMGRFVF